MLFKDTPTKHWEHKRVNGLSGSSPSENQAQGKQAAGMRESAAGMRKSAKGMVKTSAAKR